MGVANGELIEMRILLLGAAAGMAALVGGGTAAQVPGHAGAGTRPGHGPYAGHEPYAGQGARPASHAARWGSRVDGRWWGGANAPGGWGAYRRPVRGYALPTYWIAPRFYINDWSTYGLATPPQGYRWSRYYDDAVLIDARGSVYDSVSDVDWDGDYGAGYDTAGGYGADYPPAGYGDRGYGAGYPPPTAYERRDNGLGGAAIGAVAGGVAGNVIAGRGNRLGGTLIGAGVGAAAGYAIDKGEDRRRGRPSVAPYPPAAYPSGPAGYGYDSPPPAYGAGYAGPGSWTSPDGTTTVVTTSSGGYYGAGTTTVTVQSAPVVTTTTTTTDVYEDRVTYRRPAARRVYKKRWAPKPRCNCR